MFEVMLADPRSLLRLAAGRQDQSSPAIFDSRALQTSLEGGALAGYAGAKRKNVGKVHIAMDTLARNALQNRQMHHSYQR